MPQYQNLFDRPAAAATQSAVPATTAAASAPDPILISQLRQLASDKLEEIGGSQTRQLLGLSDQLLAKTRAGDTGAFGRGMNDVLRLMSSVQFDQLGSPEGLSGLVDKVRRAFKLAKVDLAQAFDSAKGQIDKICADLRQRLQVLEGDNRWLNGAYAANLNDMQALEQLLPALEAVRDEEAAKLAAMNPAEPMPMAEQRQRVDRLGRRVEAIALQIHQSKLRAMQIKGLEDANRGIHDDFRALLENAIPAWSAEIGMGLLSLRQKANIEISNRVKDQIQASMKRAADQIHDNVLGAEKALQRQAVDVATLRHVQDKTVAMIQQKIQLAEQRDRQRLQTMEELARMEQELKQSLRQLGS
ncbi:toxic anion resistance protein [Chromobacterium subtsugae]|uniref:toxic anion resistance protein n=1 Tax=Chromobacterium subtsugae TaxID=251747 RepID=UPI0006415B92|nr:toxic anion resistance protein [Chromobacterium subtsugae]